MGASSDILYADAFLMQSCARLSTQTLQFVMSRSIDLSQVAHSPIYAFIALTRHSIREAEAAPVDRMRVMRQVWRGRR
jgi:hypothetical protein